MPLEKIDYVNFKLSEMNQVTFSHLLANTFIQILIVEHLV